MTELPISTLTSPLQRPFEARGIANEDDYNGGEKVLRELKSYSVVEFLGEWGVL
jgi:hypothetical protein